MPPPPHTQTFGDKVEIYALKKWKFICSFFLSWVWKVFIWILIFFEIFSIYIYILHTPKFAWDNYLRDMTPQPPPS